MALPQAQQTGRPPSSGQRFCDAPRVVRAAGVLALTYLTCHVRGPDELTPFHVPRRDESTHSPLSTGSRSAYCNEAGNTCALPSCNGVQVRFWRARTSGLLYADAAAAGAAPVPRPRVGYRELMKNEIVANLAGVPVELAVKDIWQQVFHKAGRQYWIDLMFWIRGYFIHKAPRKVAIMITRELQMYLYDEAPVNESAWKATRRLLEEHLREWWVTCPEDPFRALTAGVWKALVTVYVDLLEPMLRGSPKLKELEDILFDPELKVIKSWTDAAHLNIVRGREEEIITKLDTLARERPRDKMTGEHSLRLPLTAAPVEDELGLPLSNALNNPTRPLIAERLE